MAEMPLKLQAELSTAAATIQNNLERQVYDYKRRLDIMKNTNPRIHCKKVDISPGPARLDEFGEIRLFYEAHYPQIFERSYKDVLLAAYHLNRNFVIRGGCLLNEFYQLLGLELTPYGDSVGWDSCVGETDYGYLWIDMELYMIHTDDGMEVCEIVFPFEPTEDCVTLR